MTLADQLSSKLEQEVTSTTPQTDEFGITPPTPETPEYWAARALIIHNRDSNGSVYCLHLRDNQLFLGHTFLKEDEATFYKLTHLRHSIKKWELSAFYRTLRSCLPKLDRRFILVAKDVLWDINRAKLVSLKEVQARLKEESDQNNDSQI